MDKKYIDAEALKQDLIKRGFYPVLVKNAIERAPAADVVEVVHGEWKLLRGMAPPEYHGRHICSECGRMAQERIMHEVLSDYCPNCGAKMDGGEHETD